MTPGEAWLVGIAFITFACFFVDSERIRHRDSMRMHQRINELRNRLDRLTAMPVEQPERAVEQANAPKVGCGLGPGSVTPWLAFRDLADHEEFKHIDHGFQTGPDGAAVVVSEFVWTCPKCNTAISEANQVSALLLPSTRACSDTAFLRDLVRQKREHVAFCRAEAPMSP